MPKITFVVDHTPKGDAPDRPTYKKGETHDLELSYADKYKRRGWAIDYVAPPPAPVVEEPKVEEAPVAHATIAPSAPVTHTPRSSFKRR